MTPWEQAISEALLHFVWQGAAIAILLWLALSMLRNYSPNTRYIASCCGLALLMLLPLVTAMVVYSSNARPEATYTQSVLRGATEFSNAVYPSVAARILDLKPYALRLWAAGVALFGLRLIWSWSHTRKLRTTGTPADAEVHSLVSRVASRLGVTRRIQVLMSTIAEVPGAIGWLRPVLLLPASAIVGLTPAQLEAVLAHELAHIRRHDYLVNLVQSLAEALLFYHPAVWWVSGRIRYERELCCDDLAVELCGDPVCYARALALLEKRRVLRPSLAMGSAGGPLVLRIRRLLMAEKREYSSWRLVCGLGLLAGVLGLALNAGQAQSQPRPLDRLTAETSSTEIAKLVQLGDVQPAERLPMAQFLESLEMTIQQIDAGLGAVNSTTRWVLFNNGQRLANASSEDEAQAERAFKSAGGPGRFLWFRHEGKTYVSQDNAIVDQILALYRTGQGRDETLIASVVQRNGELIAQADPVRQAEEEATRRQMEQLLAERSRIEAEYAATAARLARAQSQAGEAAREPREQGVLQSYNDLQRLRAQLEMQRAYEQQIREAERRTQEVNQEFEQQIRESNRRAEEIRKALELQSRETDRTPEVNEAFERQLRVAAAQLEAASAAYERQIRETDAREEINRVFEQRMRQAEAEVDATKFALERQSREAETRTQVDELKLRIQSMEAELARARAELARELADRAQPEVDRALREAIEAGKVKPVQ